MKILLLQTPVWGVYEPPFALSLLSAILKKEGEDVTAIDLNLELFDSRTAKYNSSWAIEQSFLWSDPEFVAGFFKENSEEINKHIQRILEIKPDLIGFTLNLASKLSALKYASLIKEQLPDVKIIFGGHIFFREEEGEVERILKSGLVDFIVTGEGDQAFPELVKTIKESGDFDKCLGIIYNKSGEYVRTPPRPYLKDLDSLPFLDFSQLPLDKYQRPHWLGNHLTIQMSRGCPWKCVFCGATTYWKGFRTMSGQRMYDEIAFHIKNFPDIEHIEFMDLLLNGNMRALEEFADAMIANPPKEGLRWHANAIIRPEMTPEILQKLKKSGCLRLTYGIESGSQRVLDLMKKNYRIPDADKVLKATYEAGILIKANFMFGFPGETEEDFKMTLEFLERNAKYISVAYPSFSFCVPESNSYLGENTEEFGILENSADNLYWRSMDGKNTYPERMRRWEEFSNFARGLGVDIGIGLNTSLEQHRWFNLGYYYKSIEKNEDALESFRKYLNFDPENKTILKEVRLLENSIEK
ncbi:MAG: B12-binding domain-containing radical SAM protein [Elusimicrobia bacterium]|nr:B12-binding domain-containing radical SAM protein [Elusimicrobiota bacterium]